MLYSTKPNAVTIFMSVIGVIFLLGVSWAIFAAYQAPEDEPTPTEQNGEQGQQTVRIETRIDQGASALDVRVIPIELLEDSRCPVDVQCIQAGTVRVRVVLQSGLGEAREVFELGSFITTEAEKVTLVAVEPESTTANGEIPLSQYRFIFEVEKLPPL